MPRVELYLYSSGYAENRQLLRISRLRKIRNPLSFNLAGIYLVCGRDFMGFHTRFRDVARGGIRLVLSRDKTTYDRNFATLFDDALLQISFGY